MAWIKICGITNKSDAEAITGIGVDVIGFVFFKGSPRRITSDGALSILKAIRKKAEKPPNIIPVFSISGVFVNENIDNVIETAERLNLDYIQLSGDEDYDYLLNMKQMINQASLEEKKNRLSNIKIVKSYRIKEGLNQPSSKSLFEEIYQLSKVADYLLLDSYSEKTFGGTGNTFDWNIVRDIGLSFPVILSGGLDEKNVLAAIDIVKPYGVDASSRLEISPGKKDIKKVKDFIDTVRKWNPNEKQI